MTGRWIQATAAAAISFALASACTTVASDTRLSSALRASEFNTAASRYMERPTFVSLQTMSDGHVVLKVLVDGYGTGYNASVGAVIEWAVYFDRRFVADYLPLIDKFLEWEALARERGDQIDREIGRAKTWGQMGPIDLSFAFFSGNTSVHHMLVAPCAAGACSGTPVHFSAENVRVLRGLLVDLAEGRIGHTRVEDVYR